MGAYFLSISFVWVLSTIWQLGLNQAIVRLVSSTWTTHRKPEAAGFVVASLCLTLAAMLSSYCLTLIPQVETFFIQLIPSPLIIENIHLVLLWTMLSALQSLFAETSRGLQRIDRASVFGGLTTQIIVVTSLGLCLLAGQAVTFSRIAWIYIGSTGLSVVASLLFLSSDLRSVGSFVRPQLSALIRLSWPFLVTNLTLVLLSQWDIWILGTIGSAEDVAIYGAAVRLALLTTIPLAIVNSVLPPLISELHAKHRLGNLQAILQTSAWIGFLPALGLFLMYLTAGHAILSAVFGPGYDAGYAILVVIALGYLANVAAGSPGFTLLMTGHHTAMMLITLLSAAVAITLGLRLVLTWGPLGLALGSTFGLISHTLAMWIYTRRQLAIWTHPSFSKLADLRSTCIALLAGKGASA